MYGQTKLCANVLSAMGVAESKAGSIGIAIPGGKFSLIDENGKVIEESDTIELVYQGKT